VSDGELDWVLALKDGLSAPAYRATASLKQLTAALRTTERAAADLNKRRGGVDELLRATRQQEAAQARALRDRDRLVARSGRAQGRQSAADREFGGTVLAGAMTGAALAAGAAWEALEGTVGTVARVGMGFGRFAFEAAQFHQNTMIGLRTVLGTEAAARRVFDESQRIADLTPFDTDVVVRQRMGLVMGGFDETASRRMQAALMDVGSSGEGGQDRMRVLEDAVLRLHAQGELSNHIVLGLDAARVNRTLVFSNLAHSLGIDTRDQRVMMRQVAAAISHHRVDAATAEAAIQRAVQQTFDRNEAGGLDPLGSFARKRGVDSLEGALSNLMSAPMALATSLDLEHSAGGQGFLRVLTEGARLLNKNSDTGKALGRVITDVANALGGLFGDVAGSGTLERFFRTGLDWAQGIGDAIRYATPLVRGFFDGFVGNFARAAGMDDILGRLRTTLSTAPDPAMVTFFRDLGVVVGSTAGAMVRLLDVARQINDWMEALHALPGRAQGAARAALTYALPAPLGAAFGAAADHLSGDAQDRVDNDRINAAVAAIVARGERPQMPGPQIQGDVNIHVVAADGADAGEHGRTAADAFHQHLADLATQQTGGR